MNKNQKRLSAWSSALLMSLASVGTVGTANAVVYDTDVTLSTSPTWSEDVTINSGVNVTLGENVLPGQTVAITVDIDGTLTMNSTKTDNHGADNSLVTSKSITFTGDGKFVKVGTGRLASTGADVNPSVTFAMGSGALIDIQEGTYVNGGWSKQVWTDNKADMRIAEGAVLDMWDGNSILIDSLVGAGNVNMGQGQARSLIVGVDNSTWTDERGSTVVPVFSGDFQSGKLISIEKRGTGTQILSGDFLAKGSIKVTAGTLQIGDGTNGSIGANYTGITVEDGATLAFNTDTVHKIDTISGTGTLNIMKGTVFVENFTGSYNVGQNATTNVLKNDFFTSGKNTVAEGATLYLNVNDAEADTTAFKSATFNEQRAAGKYTVGIYTQAETTATADINNVLGTNTVLTKTGMGTNGLTGENTAFTAGIVINEGGLGVGDGTTAGKISPTLAVTVNADGSFVYNNGVGTTTELLENISGDGKLVVASGTLQVTKNSPTYLENGNYATRLAVGGVTIKDGAKLYIADKVTPTFSKADGSASNGTINIEAGGVMEVNNVDSGVTHGANHSLAHSSCGLTITGAGTFLKTGNGAVALLNRENNTTAEVKIQQDVGGWIDVQGGTLVAGGWCGGINWKNNKGSLNLAEGTTINLWDNGYPITVDNLTGKGTVSRNGVILGSGNNANSETYGVANSTATFEGKIVDDSSHVGIVTKIGSGTQILAGENSYTGATKVIGGTLQFGNGDATGKIGTGAVAVNTGATLAFDTTRDNEFTSLSGKGTLAVKNTGNVTVAGGIDAFDGTVDIQIADAVVQFSPVAGVTETFTGKVTGNGTVKLNMQSDSVVNMSMATIAQNAKVSANGGALLLPKAYDGTVQATENMTVTLAQNTIRPWAMTFYVGDSDLKGRITPTTSTTQISNFIDYGTTFDMNQVANNPTNTEVATYMTQSYATFSYTNLVQVTEDIKIDLGGSFDDTQGVWVIQCDENGQIAEGAEWTTLLNYAGNCVANTKTGIDLSAGYYLMDVRVADESGSRYANGNVKDKDGNALGIGIRLNGDTNYSAFDINPETGVIAGISQMVSVGEVVTENFTFSGNLEVAEGKTLTFDNPYSDAKSYDIDTTVTGTGTLALTNSGNANATYDVNIDSEGSLSIADAMNVTLAGNIAGDLTLGDDIILNFELATTDTTPIMTVGGDVSLGENGIVNVFLTGEAPEEGILLDLALISTTEENAVVDFDPAKTNFVFSDPNLRLLLEVSGKGVHLTLGNSSSLPEPGTWTLLIVGLLGMGYVVRKKRS